MSQKPRVGQNASNALRTYNRVIGNVKTQCDKFKELGTVSGKPLRMAVVFTTRDGMIQCLGAQEWTNIIMENCADELIQSLTNQETHASSTNARVALLRLPKPVSQLNSKTLQSIIPLAMKNLQGGGYIKWEQASAKPEWWPEDVVFANVKQRPAEQSGDTPWVQCLRKVLSALFKHYGYNAETYVVEDEKDDGHSSDHGAAQQHVVEEQSIEEACSAVELESDSDQEMESDSDQEIAEEVTFQRLTSTPLSHQHGYAIAPRHNTSLTHSPMEATPRTPLLATPSLREGTPIINAITPPSAPREDTTRTHLSVTPSLREGTQINNAITPPSAPREDTPRYQTAKPTAQPPSSAKASSTDRSSPCTQLSVSRKATPKLPETPKLPRYITGKRNWVEKENDPAVQDFLGSILDSPRKRRKIRPRQVFTPSAYD